MRKKPKAPPEGSLRRSRAPTIVKVHTEKIPAQSTSGTRSARRFGALRGAVTVDAAFFNPLPPDELAAWEGKASLRPR